MIIPLSESQLRTYLETGKVTVELPEPRQPPCQIADDGTGRWTPVGMPWAGLDWWPPVKVGDRVAAALPGWSTNYYPTVATVAFERRGDRWTWIVGLEASNGND